MISTSVNGNLALLALILITGDFKQIKTLHLSEVKCTNLLNDLAKDNDWHIIHMLTNRTAHTDPVISAYKANNIQLSGLLEKCSPKEWKEWGEKLAVNLIQKRAPLDSLDIKRKHPLHAAAKMAIKTGKIRQKGIINV